MNSTQHTASTPAEPDPWEQLAEDLFGTVPGKEHTSGSTRDAGPGQSPAPEPAQIGTQRAYPEPVAQHPAPSPAHPPEATSGIAPEVIYQETAPPFAELEPPPLAEGPASEMAEPGSPTVPGDTFWDALADWDWNDSTRGSSARRGNEKSPPPRPGARRPERRETPPRGAPPDRGGAGSARPPATQPAPASRQSFEKPHAPAEPIDDGFGAGIDNAMAQDRTADQPRREQHVSHEPAFESEMDSGMDDDLSSGSAEILDAADGPTTDSAGAPGERDSATGENADHKRRRRRRRKPKSSGEQRSPGAPVGAPSGEAPDRDFESLDDDLEESANAADDDVSAESTVPGELAAGESTAGESPEKSSRRRRPRRRRGSAPAGEAAGEARGAPAEREPVANKPAHSSVPPALVESAESDDDDEDDDEVDDDDDSVDHVINYTNVPTWEEAISYLLRPSQVQVEPGSAGTGSAPHRGSPGGDGGKAPTRHYGGKRRS